MEIHFIIIIIILLTLLLRHCDFRSSEALVRTGFAHHSGSDILVLEFVSVLVSM